MAFKEFWQKEKYVIVHGQSRNFRIAKYIVLAFVLSIVRLYWGWDTVGKLVVALAVAGVAIHFILRWKTKGWKEAWGPIKPLL